MHDVPFSHGCTFNVPSPLFLSDHRCCVTGFGCEQSWRQRERKEGVEWNKGEKEGEKEGGKEGEKEGGKEAEREEGRSGVEQGREGGRGGREGGRERETIIDAEGNVITYHFLLISLVQLQFR